MKEINVYRLRYPYMGNKILYWKSPSTDYYSTINDFKNLRRIMFTDNNEVVSVFEDKSFTRYELNRLFADDIRDAGEGCGEIYELTEKELEPMLMIWELSK